MKLYAIILCAPLLLLTPLLLLNGCGEGSNKSKTANKDAQKMVSPDSLKMKPLILKGMYFYSAEASKFYDCESRKTFLIADKGENESIKKVYEKMPSRKPEEKVYVELEGFVSVQPKPTGKDMDTLLIVTTFFKLDRARKCE